MVNASLYSKKYDYIVNYCAKSGCSTIRKLFLDLHNDELSKQPPDGIHTLAHYFPVPKGKINVPTIIVVRNPFSRVVSMFLDKYINNGPIMKKAKDLGIPIDNHSFIFFLYVLLELKKLGLLNKLDDHIYEQSYGINNINNTRIVKLENFYTDYLNAYIDIFPKNNNNIIKKLNDLLLDKTKYNRTNYNLKLKDNVSHKEFHNKDNIPSYDKFYDKTCKDLVVQIYKTDFEMFNYSKEFFEL